MLDSISHIALIVRDPPRTAALFTQLFEVDVRVRKDEQDHDETFIKLGGVWFVLVQGDVDRPRSGDHIAFRVSKEVLERTKAKLTAGNREFVLIPSGTRLYFFDYDNHVFELDTGELEEELREQLGS